MGCPLGQIAEDCQRMLPQLEEAKMADMIPVVRMFLQMTLNLQLPSSESSKKLEGECFTRALETNETPMQIAYMNFTIGELLLFFGDHEARASRLLGEEKGNTLFEILPGNAFWGRTDTFHRGMVWFAMARKKKNRKYRAKALKIKKLVAKWAKLGDPNVQSYDRMLSAEEASLKKKYKLADRLYKQAIIIAARNGQVHHAALFSERFGEYRLETHGDEEDRKYYMEQAIRFYTEWGAVGKAEELKQTFVESGIMMLEKHPQNTAI